MMYSAEGDILEPDKTIDKKPIQLVDLNVLRKGPNLTTEKTAKVRKGDFKQEDKFLQEEQDRLQKDVKEIERLRKIEEAKKNEQTEARLEKQKEVTKAGEKKKEAEPEGRLRIAQVQTLPDDVDEVIK